MYHVTSSWGVVRLPILHTLTRDAVSSFYVRMLNKFEYFHAKDSTIYTSSTTGDYSTVLLSHSEAPASTVLVDLKSNHSPLNTAALHDTLAVYCHANFFTNSTTTCFTNSTTACVIFCL